MRGAEMVILAVNGKVRQAAMEADTPLLWVVGDELELTGAKFDYGGAIFGLGQTIEGASRSRTGRPSRPISTPTKSHVWPARRRSATPSWPIGKRTRRLPLASVDLTKI